MKGLRKIYLICVRRKTPVIQAKSYRGTIWNQEFANYPMGKQPAEQWCYQVDVTKPVPAGVDPTVGNSADIGRCHVRDGGRKRNNNGDVKREGADVDVKQDLFGFERKHNLESMRTEIHTVSTTLADMSAALKRQNLIAEGLALDELLSKLRSERRDARRVGYQDDVEVIDAEMATKIARRAVVTSEIEAVDRGLAAVGASLSDAVIHMGESGGLLLRVYCAGEAAEQDAMPLDAFNAPCERREKILAELVARIPGVVIRRVEKAESLELAKCVHDPQLIEFLTTAWGRWDAQQHRDPDFFGESALSDKPGATPSLVPGNYVNRDACQMAGTSVASQCAIYAADRCAPIFADLLPALLSDMGVMRALLSEVKAGECSASYALVTHPGHHASIRSYGGYCYINSAAIAAQTLLSELELERVAVIDVDYHAGNGTVGIFWEDPRVFVASIHGDPDIEYPYTCGVAPSPPPILPPVQSGHVSSIPPYQLDTSRPSLRTRAGWRPSPLHPPRRCTHPAGACERFSAALGASAPSCQATAQHRPGRRAAGGSSRRRPAAAPGRGAPSASRCPRRPPPPPSPLPLPPVQSGHVSSIPPY